MSITKTSHGEADEFLREERWERVLARVERVNQDFFYLQIMQLDPDDEAFFEVPVADFPSNLREGVKSNDWFLAEARFVGDPPETVQLRNFKEAPEPDPDDGLAHLSG